LTPQDKSKPVPLTVKVHPKVLALAQDLAAYLNDSSLDHAVSEAIQEAGKDADFRRWREAKAAHAIGQGATATGKAKRASSDAHRTEGAA
jgi:hypothetical protein